jgi:phage repressor protein C with HTH and peptisase S24 domain
MHLKEIRKARKLTLEQLAKKVGTTKSNLSLIENGKISMSVDKAEKIANILNCHTTDLTGGTKFNPEITTKMIAIKYYNNIAASAGTGCFVNNEEFEIINIDESQLIKMGIKRDYNNISIINAKGDSMFPTIRDGDLLFVNIGKKEVFNNKIYIINEDDLLKVKRILKTSPFDEEVTIKSDNKVDGEYPPYSVKIDNIKNIICGQVIFFCRNIE